MNREQVLEEALKKTMEERVVMALRLLDSMGEDIPPEDEERRRSFEKARIDMLEFKEYADYEAFCRRYRAERKNKEETDWLSS